MTSTTLGTYLKVELLLGLIFEWSHRDKIEALNGALMALSEAKARSDNDASVERFQQKLKQGR